MELREGLRYYQVLLDTLDKAQLGQTMDLGLKLEFSERID